MYSLKPYFVLILLALSTALTACVEVSGGGGYAANAAPYAGPSGVGVTQGGSQDLGLARDLLAQGGIPGKNYYTAEGIFSEHDLPLAGAPCEALLCPRASAALVRPLLPAEPAGASVEDVDRDPPSGTRGEGAHAHSEADGFGPLTPAPVLLDPRLGEASMLVQLGFGTRLSQEAFRRRALNLSIAVDVSGSMQGDKIESVREALLRLIAQLDAADRLSLVLFDHNAWVVLDPTTMDESGRALANAVVAEIATRGSTDIEAGLRLAYEQVVAEMDGEDRSQRVMLFTDARPNVGARDPDSFVSQARHHAEAGIGLTLFGVGLDLGATLARELSELRGGNYFYLADAHATTTVFDEDFDYLVSPVAYDLEVSVEAPEGWRFVRAYGAPMNSAEPVDTISFGVSTLFFSRRNGGIGVELRPEEGGELGAPPAELGQFTLRFETVEGELVETSLGINFAGGDAYYVEELGEESPRADDLGVFKMAGLLTAMRALDAGADFCNGDINEVQAAGLIQGSIDQLEAMAELEGAESLADMLATLRTLFALVVAPIGPACF